MFTRHVPTTVRSSGVGSATGLGEKYSLYRTWERLLQVGITDIDVPLDSIMDRLIPTLVCSHSRWSFVSFPDDSGSYSKDRFIPNVISGCRACPKVLRHTRVPQP